MLTMMCIAQGTKDIDMIPSAGICGDFFSLFHGQMKP